MVHVNWADTTDSITTKGYGKRSIFDNSNNGKDIFGNTTNRVN